MWGFSFVRSGFPHALKLGDRMKNQKNKKKLGWRIHTANFLAEATNNNLAPVLHEGMVIFSLLLQAVAKRAIELDDRELNKLMIRLTLYKCADPESAEYQPDLIREYLEETG